MPAFGIEPSAEKHFPTGRRILSAIAVGLFALTLFHVGQEPLRSFNHYGLFAVMTPERPEIILEGSNDGKTWRTVYATTAGDGGQDVDSFPATQARYVRMQGVHRATGWGYSLYQFQVYAQ